MSRPTEAERLAQRARYPIGAAVEVFTIFTGWTPCLVTRHGWDGIYGRVQYHVRPVDGTGGSACWLTHEAYMRPAKLPPLCSENPHENA